MADLLEENLWTPGIYQLETSDPVLGGPDGIDNLQAKQLASRTRWLKAQLEQVSEGKQDADSTLVALAALTFSPNQIIYSTGPDAFALATLSAFIRTLLDDADGESARNTLGAAALDSPEFTGTPEVPTPPQFDSSKLAVNAEFVQRALGSYGGLVIYPGSVALGVGDIGKLVSPGGTASTITLPDASLVPQGALVTVLAGVGGATFQAKAGQTLSSLNSTPGPFTLPAATLAVFRRLASGSGWVLEGGDSALKYSALFGASLTGTTCHQRLPSGDIEQWGLYVAAPSGSDTVITLPMAMLAAPSLVELTFANYTNGENVGTAPVLQARNSTPGTITVRNLHSGAASFFWKVRGRV